MTCIFGNSFFVQRMISSWSSLSPCLIGTDAMTSLQKVSRDILCGIHWFEAHMYIYIYIHNPFSIQTQRWYKVAIAPNTGESLFRTLQPWSWLCHVVHTIHKHLVCMRVKYTYSYHMTSHDRIIDINRRRKKHVPSHLFYNWSDLHPIQSLPNLACCQRRWRRRQLPPMLWRALCGSLPKRWQQLPQVGSYSCPGNMNYP